MEPARPFDSQGRIPGDRESARMVILLTYIKTQFTVTASTNEVAIIWTNTTMDNTTRTERLTPLDLLVPRIYVGAVFTFQATQSPSTVLERF